MKKPLALASVVLLAATGLALSACSSSSGSASPASSASVVGGDPGTWTPITITPDDVSSNVFSAVVGQSIVFTMPLKNADGESRVLQTSDPAIVEVVSQADEAGTVTFAAKAVGVGSADVTIGVPGAPTPDGGGFIINVSAE